MTYFERLSAAEQAAVAEYARREWENVASLSPPAYISENAKADPEGWRTRLCELVWAIMESAQRGLVPQRGVLQLERGSRLEGCRRGGGQHVESAKRRMEELRKDTQTPCSHSVRRFRYPQSSRRLF
jgi:hypothetical protein